MNRVRSVTTADEARLYLLASDFPTPTPPTKKQFRSAFREKLSDPNSCVIVVENADRLVGYLSGYSHTTFYAGGPTAWIDELLVEEACRHRGLGRELMDYFEAWAAANGCILVGLATGGARDFYSHLGFESKAGYYKKYLRSKA